MTVPPDDPFGTPVTDPTDELASALLDEGRVATDPGLDPVVAARLRAMTTARRALRDVPKPDAAGRERAIAAALAAFGAGAHDDQPHDDVTNAPPEPSTVVTPADRPAAGGAVVGIDRARAARSGRRSAWAPQRLLGAAAAIAVLGLGAFAVSRSSGKSTSSGAAGSFASKAAGGATTAAASAAPAADAVGAAIGAGGGAEEATTAAAATTSAAGATTTAAAGALTTAATAAASTPAAGTTATGAAYTSADDLPSLGAVRDLPQLRSRLTAIVSLEPSTSLPGSSTVPPSTAPRSRTSTSIDGAVIVQGADCSARGAVIATLTWQDLPAYVLRDERGYAVIDATDCRELVRP